ncbi:MAG TPA: universal stress protein [Solirubrobacteraceae bacterium]|nr:universal stress protein [Solirubrobacteraceae bacterium]
MFEKIVVGYAGDEAGRDAVKLGGRLAAALGASLTVVYPYSPLLYSVSTETAETCVRDELQTLLPAGQELPPVSYRWSSSSWPIHALHGIAADEDAGLIVLGAARKGLAAHLHASLMERLVHGAPCAVLVAPAGYADRDDGGWRRIGVGFTDSPEGRTALRLAHSLAGIFGAELSVLAASWLRPIVRGYAGIAIAVSALEADTYTEIRATVERAVAELDSDTPVSTLTVNGDPCNVLVEQSDKLDLLVLGSRAYGPLRHALLGSVSAPVMREAHCPVLVVPRGARSDASEADSERATITAGAG